MKNKEGIYMGPLRKDAQNVTVVLEELRELFAGDPKRFEIDRAVNAANNLEDPTARSYLAGILKHCRLEYRPPINWLCNEDAQLFWFEHVGSQGSSHISSACLPSNCHKGSRRDVSFNVLATHAQLAHLDQQLCGERIPFEDPNDPEGIEFVRLNPAHLRSSRSGYFWFRLTQGERLNEHTLLVHGDAYKLTPKPIRKVGTFVDLEEKILKGGW